MRFGRIRGLLLAATLAMGVSPAAGGPLAVVADFTDPLMLGVFAEPGTGWPDGTVSIIDTATDKLVTSIKVGANPMAVAITPDGKTAVVACAQDSELHFIDLTPAVPRSLGMLKVGQGRGDTFYPASLAISPDGDFVAVASLAEAAGSEAIGSQPVKGEIDKILLVNIKERTIAQTVQVRAEDSPLGAEAVAFTPQGSLLVVSPKASPAPVIFALGYEYGQITGPEIDEETRKNRMGALQNSTGLNLGIAPDGSFAIVPLGQSADGNSGVVVLHIDATGKLTDEKAEPVPSGGDAPHSVAISPDGKLAYIRNVKLPNANIAVFSIEPGPTLKDTGLRLKSEGFPKAVVDSRQAGSIGYVGSQMIAVTPDGRKVYAANTFGGEPPPVPGLKEVMDLLGFTYGRGNIQVFEAGKAEPIRTLEFGINPIAIAIQRM